MLSPRHLKAGAICAFGLLMAACATHVTAPSRAAAPPVAVAPAPLVALPAPAVLSDPVADLIAESSQHFAAGEREVQLGHLVAAKGEFNRALDVLLESPFGARTEPRLREHFDQLVERISAYELTALAQGDGFAAQKTDPASIDDILNSSTFEIPAPTAETTQTVTADLRSIAYDIDIPLNAKVLAFVQLLSGRLKSFLEEGMSRGVQYLPMIQDVFRAEGLPLDLAYVPLVESAFKPTALSRAKAKGIWQFMTGTGLENGLTHDWYIDERAEPEKATRAAAKYLKTLADMFDGDWHLALASYNGGPGRVQRAIKRAGKPDFWKISASSRYLPRETRDYVPLILAAIVIARNPAQYGMEVQPFQPQPFETVTLSSAVDLRRVAEWVGVPVQTIQELNPELRRWTTPIKATDYELKVPEGSGDIVRSHLAQSDPDELAPLNWYTVKKGDTLLSVAKKLKVNRTDLAEANYLSTKAKVGAGQRLIIPRAPEILLATRTDNPVPLIASEQTEPAVVAAAEPAVTPASTSTTGQRTSIVYRVKRGDTLASIAKLYRTTVTSLKNWNRLRTNALQVGQRLTVVTQRSALSTN